MDKQVALIELTRADAEAGRTTFEQFVREALRAGIPLEVLTRLEDLWRTTRRIAGHVVRIGRIVVLRIVEFVKTNPHLSVGAALGAIVALLVTSAIPWLGALLAPFASTVAAVYGAGVAASHRRGGGTSPFEAAKALAESFMGLMLSILDGVSEYLEGARDE